MSVTTREQAQIDQQVVNANFADIVECLNRSQQADQLLRARYHAAIGSIGDLYEEFCPEVAAKHTVAFGIAAALGAAGLLLVEQRFGIDEQTPKLYSGRYEQDVLATYHQGGHSRRYMRNMFWYMAAANHHTPGRYDEGVFNRAPIMSAYHDAVMGNDRGNDERQAALLAAAVMCAYGFTLLPDEEAMAGIQATTWDAARQRQSVHDTDEYIAYRRAGAVADLLPVWHGYGLYDTACLFTEDMCKRRADRLFTVEANKAGFVLEGASVDDCMAFVDKSKPLTAAFEKFLREQMDLYSGKTFKPADPALDELFPRGRQTNIERLERIIDRYPRHLSALSILHQTREYAMASGFYDPKTF